jgi:hypothetical protein
MSEDKTDTGMVPALLIVTISAPQSLNMLNVGRLGTRGVYTNLAIGQSTSGKTPGRVGFAKKLTRRLTRTTKANSVGSAVI